MMRNWRTGRYCILIEKVNIYDCRKILRTCINSAKQTQAPRQFTFVYIYTITSFLLFITNITYIIYICIGGWWNSAEDASLLFRGLGFDPHCHRLIFVVVYPCT